MRAKADKLATYNRPTFGATRELIAGGSGRPGRHQLYPHHSKSFADSGGAVRKAVIAVPESVWSSGLTHLRPLGVNNCW